VGNEAVVCKTTHAIEYLLAAVVVARQETAAIVDFALELEEVDSEHVEL
jgi:hypothetical protein